MVKVRAIEKYESCLGLPPKKEKDKTLKKQKNKTK